MAAPATSEQEDPELAATAWDLEPLVDGEGQEGVQQRLSEALERAKTFAAHYAGSLAELDSPRLREAMNEQAAIYELVAEGNTVSRPVFIENYERAFELYQRTDFQGAVELLKRHPNDKPSQVLAARCRFDGEADEQGNAGHADAGDDEQEADAHPDRAFGEMGRVRWRATR